MNAIALLLAIILHVSIQFGTYSRSHPFPNVIFPDCISSAESILGASLPRFTRSEVLSIARISLPQHGPKGFGHWGGPRSIVSRSPRGRVRLR